MLIWLSTCAAGDYTAHIKLFDGNRLLLRPGERCKHCDVVLVLSGGGARGLAQIGVLQVLDSAGVEPDIVVGTSMGAVVGGLYAAGFSPAKLESLAKNIDWAPFFTDVSRRTSLFLTQRESSEQYFLTLRFAGWKPYLPQGYLSAQHLLDFLSELTAPASILAEGDFDKLPRRFRSVVTDIASGEVVVLSRGNLGEAIRASVGVPLLFLPFPVESIVAVDGGLKMPVPVEVARSLGCRTIIAVNTTASLLPREKLSDPAAVAEQATTIMQQDVIAKERALADIWIEPALGPKRSTDFSDVDALISAGRRAALRVLDSLKHKTALAQTLHIDSVEVEGACAWDEMPIGKGEISSGKLRSQLEELARGSWAREISCSLSSSSPRVLRITCTPAPEVKFLRVDGMPGGNKLLRTDSPTFGQVCALVDSFVQLLRQRGFAIARLESAVVVGETLVAQIDPGRIASVRTSGNDLTRRWVIECRLGIGEGEIFDLGKVKSGIDALYSSGLFNWVNYDLAPSDSGVVLTVKVSEKPRFAVRVGARYDRISKAEVALGIFDENLFGTALRLAVEGWAGERRQNANISLGADRIWKTLFTGSISAGYRRYRFDEFENFEITGGYWIEHYGAAFALGHQLKRFGTLWGELATRRIRTSPVAEESGPIKHYTMHKLRVSSLVDTYDKRQFPTSGSYYHLSFEMSQDILGGQTSFSKFFAHLGAYHTFGFLTVHPWVLGGHISGTPPFFERFCIGTGERFWGLRGDELVGDDIINAGANVRINLRKRLKRLYILLGASMGNLWAKDLPPEVAKTVWGAGAGIGLETPLGPLKLTWGLTNMKTNYLFFSWGFDFQ